MRRVLRVLGGVVLVSAIAAGACAAYIEATWRRDFSSTPLPAVTVSSDPEVIARGEYLFHAVAHCSSCHAPDAPSPGVPSGGPAIEAGNGAITSPGAPLGAAGRTLRCRIVIDGPRGWTRRGRAGLPS